jgi:hypothetical protein
MGLAKVREVATSDRRAPATIAARTQKARSRTGRFGTFGVKAVSLIAVRFAQQLDRLRWWERTSSTAKPTVARVRHRAARPARAGDRVGQRQGRDEATVAGARWWGRSPNSAHQRAVAAGPARFQVGILLWVTRADERYNG